MLGKHAPEKRQAASVCACMKLTPDFSGLLPALGTPLLGVWVDALLPSAGLVAGFLGEVAALLIFADRVEREGEALLLHVASRGSSAHLAKPHCWRGLAALVHLLSDVKHGCGAGHVASQPLLQLQV